MWSYGPILGLTAGVTIGMQLFFFFIAYTFQFDKVTDIAGSMNFALNVWLAYGLGGGHFPRQLVNTILVTVWGCRLGFYLLARVLKRGHDSRFDEMRLKFGASLGFFILQMLSKFGAFLGFFIFQMLWVWLVTLPVLILNGTSKDVALNAQDYVGWALWAIGFVIEVWADQSKTAFMQDGNNRGRIIMSGIWSWTRHPNYAGEITLWIGIFISSCTALIPNHLPGAFVSIISPIFTFVILMFGSGCPLAEEKYNKRHRQQAWYLEYRSSTSPLIPMPPSLYKALPSWFKTIFLFEYPLYAKGLGDPPSNSVTETLAPANQTYNSA